MPRYFFDTDDGDFQHRDESGQDLPDLQAARALAIETLPDIARDKISDGDRQSFAVRVRDETGAGIYSARLAFTGKWLVAAR